ncbi:hypothetical protein BEI_1342 [Halomonas beimenensis]|uniref:Uncharacterized protein n=1 Tax=Halomonas beimenensis TaxID=475662 RepID=A0A291P649_9GAMM|nr:hypothetical protein BEI_1342 [Halomonas beimenensis]
MGHLNVSTALPTSGGWEAKSRHGHPGDTTVPLAMSVLVWEEETREEIRVDWG